MLNPITNIITSISYELDSVDEFNCAHTKNGWKVIFPTIEIADDDDQEDRRFKKFYAAAIEQSEHEILKHAEKMSQSKIPYSIGQWHKCVNASFCHKTQRLHDYVMGHNHCDDLMFRLDVIDNHTLEIH